MVQYMQFYHVFSTLLYIEMRLFHSFATDILRHTCGTSEARSNVHLEMKIYQKEIPEQKKAAKNHNALETSGKGIEREETQTASSSCDMK